MAARNSLFLPGSVTGPRLVLASQSPRRAELLGRLGIPFIVDAVDIDEESFIRPDPVEYALAVSREKGYAVQKRHRDSWVLSADTVVVTGQGAQTKLLGKPRDAEEAREMLQSLSGRVHQVVTAFCLLNGNTERSRFVSTDVAFRELSASMITAYIETGEPFDKAGGYGVQGIGALFVSSVNGSYSNVVGLPLTELYEELRSVGVWSGIS